MPAVDGDVSAQLSAAVLRSTGIKMLVGDRLTTLKHGVTRFRITLICYQGTWHEGKLRRRQLRWVLPQDLEHFPLSMTARKIARLLS
jgi:A/G-specific adenine glycosylase